MISSVYLIREVKYREERLDLSVPFRPDNPDSPLLEYQPYNPYVCSKINTGSMILPTKVITLIEDKIGKEIRYPIDCEHLAYDIEKETKLRISANTLKRLFGFLEDIKKPRLYTLDVVAKYLGFKNWDFLELSFKEDKEDFL